MPTDGYTLRNATLPEPGATATSPIAGTIRRWRVQGTGTYALQVLHPNGGGSYTCTGTSAPGVTAVATGAGPRRHEKRQADADGDCVSTTVRRLALDAGASSDA